MTNSRLDEAATLPPRVPLSAQESGRNSSFSSPRALEEVAGSCSRVSVRSIISKLGEKLDVGSEISTPPFGTKRIFRMGDNDSLSCLDLRNDRSLPGVSPTVADSYSSMSDTSWIFDSSLGSLSVSKPRESLTSPSDCKRNSRSYYSPQQTQPAELPPAFRVSMSAGRQSQTRPWKAKSHQFKPSPLLRHWPPVSKTYDVPFELHSTSLSTIRSMSCVRSKIPSFELRKLSSSDIRETIAPRPSYQRSSSTPKLMGETLPIKETGILLNSPNSTTNESSRPHMKRKASLKVRWKGPEIFYIPANNDSWDDEVDYEGSEDRFRSSIPRDMSMNPLLPDRFGTRDLDSLPMLPPRPRRGSTSSDEEISLGSIGEDGFKDIPAFVPLEPPAVWIAVYEPSEGSDELEWRVKRVWQDATLDALENEIVVDAKSLVETVNFLSHPTLDDSNHKKRPTDCWELQKVYDVGGFIEYCCPEKLIGEFSLLDEAIAMAKERQPTVSTTLSPLERIRRKKATLPLPPPPIVQASVVEDEEEMDHAELHTTGKDAPSNDDSDSTPNASNVDQLNLDAPVPNDENDDTSKLVGVDDEPEPADGIVNGDDHDTTSRIEATGPLVAEDREGIQGENPSHKDESVVPSSGMPSNEDDDITERGASNAGENDGDTTRAKQGKKDKKKRKNKKREMGSIASLLSPPPVITFHFVE